MTDLMDLDLTGRRAFVTGSTRGLGLMTAGKLRAAGADVGLLGRTRVAVDAAEEDLLSIAGRPSGSIQGFVGDLSDANAVSTLIDDIDASDWDILVNCAGVAVYKPLPEIEWSDWNGTLAVNLDAPFLLSQALSMGMVSRGWGRIVNVSSHSGLRTSAGSLSYSVSKAALQMLTKSLAVELGPEGVRANAICPTIFLSDMGRELWGDPDLLASKVDQIPAKRLGTLAELAELILYLVSPAADFINGAVISVDGGLFAGRPKASGLQFESVADAELAPDQRSARAEPV